MKKKRMYLEVEPYVELYVEEAGEGTPMLLIPGLTYSSDIFAAQIEHFSKTHRVIAMDPRGQGRSTKTTFGNNYTVHGQDVAKVMEQLNLQGVVIVGWSTGNLEVWSYVRQFGTANLKASIVIDMPPKPMSHIEGDWVEGAEADLSAAITQFLTTQKGQRDFFADYAKELMVQRELTDEELFFIVDLSNRSPCYIPQGLYGDAILQDYRPEATRLENEVPSLMFLAEHWSGVAQPYMEKTFPKTKTVVMGGHLMFWEYPEKFNAEVEKFLAEA